MALQLFADTASQREIPIPEIDPSFTITLRNELSIGEQRAIYAKAFKGQVTLANGDIRNEYDMSEVAFGQVCAYLVEWSPKDEVNPDAIKALKPKIYGLIEEAVQAHVESLEKKEPAKSGRGTKPEKRNGAPTSPSAIA
jgi:hypothetical protein